MNTLLEILQTVSNNLDTNLTTEEILSFYNIFKDILASRKYQSNDDFLNIIQIKLAGDGRKQYFSNLKANLWVYNLNEKSIKSASHEMKVNLNKEDAVMEKVFTFNP